MVCVVCFCPYYYCSCRCWCYCISSCFRVLLRPPLLFSGYAILNFPLWISPFEMKNYRQFKQSCPAPDTLFTSAEKHHWFMHLANTWIGLTVSRRTHDEAHNMAVVATIGPQVDTRGLPWLESPVRGCWCPSADKTAQVLDNLPYFSHKVTLVLAGRYFLPQILLSWRQGETTTRHFWVNYFTGVDVMLIY